MFGTILLVLVDGLSIAFLVCVLVNFLVESREKKILGKVLHAVTADKWNRPYSGWSGW